MVQVGGMGDVVTALGRAVQEEGHKVEVILPKYDCIQYDEVGGSNTPVLSDCTALNAVFTARHLRKGVLVLGLGWFGTDCLGLQYGRSKTSLEQVPVLHVLFVSIPS